MKMTQLERGLHGLVIGIGLEQMNEQSELVKKI